MEEQEDRFLLAGEEDAFKEKAGNLFSALNGVQYSPTQDVDGLLKSDPLRDGRQPKFGGAHESNTRQNKSSTASGHRSKHDGGLMPPPKVPTFKRKRGRPTPGHAKNPSKYTKYSLDDVPDQQMTQKSNTAAALAFLQEIDEKLRKDQTEDETPEGEKPMFKKPTHKAAPRTDGEHECSSTESPESDLADASQSKPKLKHTSKKKEKEIKLSHLEYEDE